jgi:hypothetical protein
MSSFATLADVLTITGKEYTGEEMERIEALLCLVSDTLRVYASNIGKDLDQMVQDSEAYGSVVKLTVVDIVVRAMRASLEGEPMVQESQSAIGYTWSGTYAIPGGGIGGAIMKNDLKRLGLRRQKYGTIEFYERRECCDTP